jgi:hypothetical protein
MLFLVLCGIVVFSCSSVKPTQKETSCDQSLKEFVQDYWKFDKDSLIRLDILETRDFCSEMLPENKCLFGRNMKEIESLFGTPHRIVKQELWYYVNYTCYSPNSRDCLYIHFDFDQDSIYKEIGVSGWNKSH